MEVSSSTGFGPSLLAILLVVCLTLGLASGAAPSSLAAAVQDASFEYDYNASYNLSGKTSVLSADLTMDHGVPALHFTDGEHVLTLQNGQLLYSSGSGPAKSLLPPAVWEIASEIIPYLSENGLQKDIETLKPFFSDLLSYNAYTLSIEAVTRDPESEGGDAAAATRYSIDTTPVRLLGALQRWLIIRGADPRLKNALNELEIVRLPAVQQALADAQIDLGAVVARALLSAANSLSSPITQIPSDGDQNALLPIHLEGVLMDGAWESGLLTIGNPAKQDQGFWLQLIYQSGQGTELDSADLTVRYQGKTCVSAHAGWLEESVLEIDGSWAVPAYGDQYTGGDFYLAAAGMGLDPVFHLSLSVYGQRSSPSLTLSYANRELSFLYIQNSAYADSYSDYYFNDDDDAAKGLSALSNQPSFLQGTLSWDDSDYSVYVRGSRFEFQGQGAYEIPGDGFHQKGDFQLALLTREAASRFDIHVEQTLTTGPRSFRLTQHLDASPAGVAVPLLTYNDRHALSIR